MIPRTLVPVDVRPLAATDGAKPAPRRLSSTLDLRTIVPRDLPIKELDGKNSAHSRSHSLRRNRRPQAHRPHLAPRSAHQRLRAHAPHRNFARRTLRSSSHRRSPQHRTGAKARNDPAANRRHARSHRAGRDDHRRRQSPHQPARGTRRPLEQRLAFRFPGRARRHHSSRALVSGNVQARPDGCRNRLGQGSAPQHHLYPHRRPAQSRAAGPQDAHQSRHHPQSRAAGNPVARPGSCSKLSGSGSRAAKK